MCSPLSLHAFIHTSAGLCFGSRGIKKQHVALIYDYRHSLAKAAPLGPLHEGIHDHGRRRHEGRVGTRACAFDPVLSARPAEGNFVEVLRCDEPLRPVEFLGGAVVQAALPLDSWGQRSVRRVLRSGRWTERVLRLGRGLGYQWGSGA